MKLLYQKFCEDSLVFTILVILTDLVLAVELCGVKGSCSIFCLEVICSRVCLLFFLSFLRVWICDYVREREKDENGNISL